MDRVLVYVGEDIKDFLGDGIEFEDRKCMIRERNVEKNCCIREWHLMKVRNRIWNRWSLCIMTKEWI
jgi:hypothetical protein